MVNSLWKLRDSVISKIKAATDLQINGSISLNGNKIFDFTSKSLKKVIFVKYKWFHQKNCCEAYHTECKKTHITWHSFSTSLAWQILKSSGVFSAVYLPVSIRSRWFPRRNSLIADLWRGFFYCISPEYSVLLVSVLKVL